MVKPKPEGTGWLYVSKLPFEKMGFPENIGITSFPKLTKDFLGMVNLTLVTWPALLGGFYMATHKKPHEGHDNEIKNETGNEKKPKEDIKHE